VTYEEVKKQLNYVPKRYQKYQKLWNEKFRE